MRVISLLDIKEDKNFHMGMIALGNYAEWLYTVGKSAQSDGTGYYILPLVVNDTKDTLVCCVVTDNPLVSEARAEAWSDAIADFLFHLPTEYRYGFKMPTISEKN